MDQQLFRKESIERISSPEELHDYMKVTSPRTWMILAGIVALLAGFMIYASVTTIESTTGVSVYSQNGEITAELNSDQQNVVGLNMPVRVNGKTGYVQDINQSEKMLLDVSFDGDSVLPDGYYELSVEDDGTLPEKLKHRMFSVSVNGDKVSVNYNGSIPLKDYLTPGTTVQIGGKKGTVNGVNTYAASTISVMLDEPDAVLPDGTYSAEIVTQSVTPIRFLLN